MNMDEVTEPVEEVSQIDLQEQLNTAKEEIQSLTQQLNCLLLIAKNAWHGDETATAHLARVIGLDPEIERHPFFEKKTTTRSSAKKTVKIADDDEIVSKQTLSLASSTTSQENLQEQPVHVQAAVRNTYLQPFLKQSHIDPIRGQNSRRIFNNMVRHHQNEMRKPPIIANRNSSASVRPRATKHLYRPASAEHVVRHLGSPLSRAKPYFVFAGKEFFQRTTNYSPLYQRALVTSNGSRQSEHSDLSDESEVIPSPTTEPIIARPQTAKSTQQSSALRFATHSTTTLNRTRASSTLSNSSTTKVKQISERERRDAMRLQRQLNLPRHGWLNQHS
ncbi:unnamed protein product [Rotaria sordida]|uniref:Uncharacterized protein n=1 Tax=Rotaria sordida TaxID=392033 RepID=A0A814VAC9_9BILA|nr:unnamed protein product [Rotaria sordida]CAF0778408.1 unnamed protein product [Rotaria sordida]CAF1185537.1 unnamed protein product [Rotaria sordida]CAF3713895.1 unnamed protein product [Rotaria sordida]CAF3730364.1 unnamed protein product [Rotaria sordida]